MSISNKFWIRLRDNIWPIVFLSALQILVMLMSPGYPFLGATANAIMKSINIIIGVMLLIWVFTTCDIEKRLLGKFAQELDEPMRTYIKYWTIAVGWLTVVAIIYYADRLGYFKYASSFYMMGFIQVFFFFYFLRKALEKRKREEA